jgi:hypothetical protein
MRRIPCPAARGLSPLLLLLLLLAAGCGAPELTDADRWWLEPPASARYVAFSEDGRWGYRDRAGNVIIPPQYELAVSFPEEAYVLEQGERTVVKVHESAPLGRVRLNGRWGYVDPSGRLVIPPRFEQASDFFTDMTSVRVGDRWGYIDRTGRMVIPPRYDEASPFLRGVAHVRQGGEWLAIDRSGRRLPR